LVLIDIAFRGQVGKFSAVEPETGAKWADFGICLPIVIGFKGNLATGAEGIPVGI